NRENAVLEFGVYLFVFYLERQPQRARKGAVAPLGIGRVSVRLLSLGLFLALDSQYVASEAHLEVLVPDTGELGRDHHLLLGFAQVNRRRDCARAVSEPAAEAVEEVIEHAVHLAPEGHKRIEIV